MRRRLLGIGGTDERAAQLGIGEQAIPEHLGSGTRREGGLEMFKDRRPLSLVEGQPCPGHGQLGQQVWEAMLGDASSPAPG